MYVSGQGRDEGTVRLPRGTRIELGMVGCLPAEWIVPPGVHTDAVLLYLHRGSRGI
jgi:hypothetical protein